MTPRDEPVGDTFTPAQWRRTMFGILMLVTLSATTARIIAVERVYEPSLFKADTSDGYRADDPDPPPRTWPRLRPEPTPMFSSNDRSRWATVRALVDEGTFAIGERIDDPNTLDGYRDAGIIFENDYASVDRILNPETMRFYSSKPPLLTLVVAGQYWLLKHTIGWSIVSDRWPVMVTILVGMNLLPFALFLVLMGRLIEQYGRTDWGKLIAFTIACFGMYLLPFANTLNNHSLGVVLTLMAVYPLMHGTNIVSAWTRRNLFLSGLSAAMLFTLELPGLALLLGLAGMIAWVSGKRVGWYLAGASLPLIAMAVSMIAATGELIPAYAKFGGPWYEYSGSHWMKLSNPNARGIDFAKEPKWLYGFQLLFGHHGIFSLTPVWLLGGIGMVGISRRWNRTRLRDDIFGMIATLSLLISVVVIGFFIAKTNNYGGWTSGPRWLFWLTPLWLLTMLPLLDRLSMSRMGQRVVLVCVAVTVFTVHYPLVNPWRHPWLYQMCEYCGWLRY